MLNDGTDDTRTSKGIGYGQEVERQQPGEKIWVTAESFGYGPSAIAFNLLSQFRRLKGSETGLWPKIEFIGSGLALELTRSPPWDAIHLCDVHSREGRDKLEKLFNIHRPRLLVTIGDQAFAEAATSLRVPVVAIDALLWFWKTEPIAWRAVDLLLAPNFVGVAERIRSSKASNACVVPALRPWPMQASLPLAHERKGTLVNLGGLQTPMMPPQINIDYARMVLRAVRRAIERCDDDRDRPLIALGSESIREALHDEFPGCFQTASPNQARQALLQCRTAFLTAGMGNILDSVDLAYKAAFLPACSETQGLQPMLLTQAGAELTVIDWHHIIPEFGPIDYWAPLQETFAEIRKAHESASASDSAGERLAELCREVLRGKSGNTDAMRHVLPNILGRGDGCDYARAIADAGLGFTLDRADDIL